MTEEEIVQEFRDERMAPILDTVRVGERVIHFASIDQKRDNLLVFIHGSPGSWTAFIEYFKIDSILEVTDIISIDRPGFGLSDRGEPEPSMELQARYMNAVTRQFPHQKKILVGHSLGGPVIARMAMDYPMDYHGLLFLAPSIDPNMEKEEKYRQLIQTKFGGWVTPEDFWVSNEEILPLKEELQQMTSMWNRISSKSIVIQGTDDRLVPKENANFAKKMMADSLLDVWILEGANHFLPWNREETIIKAIYQLLGI